jgi:hypothetical protein
MDLHLYDTEHHDTTHHDNPILVRFCKMALGFVCLRVGLQGLPPSL